MKDEAYRAECRRQARERFDREYGGSEASSPPGEPSPGDTYGAVQAARQEWERSPALRAEFGEFERYAAFKKADQKGLVKNLQPQQERMMALFDFARVKATIADLAAELKKLRAEREALLQKREDLEGAPISQADLVELIDRWIDPRAADFPKRLEIGVDYYRRHVLVSLPENPKAAVHPLMVLTAVADPNAMATLQTLEGSLFFVLRDQIKAGLRQAIEQLDFSAAGPPRAERLETIAAIDARIDAIDKLEQSLTEEAEKAGLKI